ncbi:unnamed protein product [Acanthosepion pharaonis]|uniref:Uncharacterized protein n=1 Tax=Acanthosepion pharaonis TaxID=158019 RepID=A0A812E5V2_ACAPH|nr:unnamed protein product [Sepia pharaonis]
MYLVYPLLWTQGERGKAERGNSRRPADRLARSAPRNSIVSRDRRMYWFYPLLWTLLPKAERGTRRPGSPSSPYIPSRLVAHRATPSSLETDGCIGLSSPLDTHKLARPRGGTRRPGSPSSPYIPSRLVAHRATPSSLETDGCIGLSSSFDTARRHRATPSSLETDGYWFILFWTLLARPRGELDVRQPLVLHISRPGPPVAHRATPSSLETDGCIGLSSLLDTASKAENRPRAGELNVRAALSLFSISVQARSAPRNSIVSRDRRIQTDVLVYPLLWTLLARPRGELDVRAALVPPYPVQARSAPRNSIVSLETDGCIGLSSPWTLLARLRGGTRRPGSPSSPYIPSRLVAHGATPSSLETDGCIGLSSPLDIASKAERGTRRPGSPSRSALRNSIVSRDRRMYWFILSFLARPEHCSGQLVLHIPSGRAGIVSRQTDDVRAALARSGDRRESSPLDTASKAGGTRRPGPLHISRQAVAHRATPSSPRQTDVLVYPLLWTLLSNAEGELDVRAALAVARNSIVSRDRRMYWFILLWTLLARPRGGTRRPGSPSSPYIPSRLVAHRATPSFSRQTDQGREGLRGGTPYVPSRAALHRLSPYIRQAERGEQGRTATPSSLETDGCIGLSAPLDTASKAERARSAPRNSIVSRDRRMYWFIPPLDTASKAERGTRRPGSPNSPYVPSRPVAHRATPSSLETDGCLVAHRNSIFTETDGCIGLSSLLDTLARPGQTSGSPDSPYPVQACSAEGQNWTSLDSPCSPYIRPRPWRTAQLHLHSRQTDVLVYPLPLDTASKAERGTKRPGSPSSPYIPSRPARSAPRNSIFTRDRRMYSFILSLDIASAPRNPSSLETDGCIGLSFDTAPLDTRLVKGPERGIRRPGQPWFSIYPVQARRPGTSATPSSLETDGCIGLSSPLDTASKAEGELDVRAALVLHISRPGSKAERGTRRPGSPSSLIYPVQGRSARATHLHPRQTDVLFYPLLWTLLARPRGGTNVRAALVLHILSRARSAPRNSIFSRDRRMARSAPRNPSSLETDGCIGYPLLWTLLAKPRGELDVRAALVLIYPVQARGTAQLHRLSRQTDRTAQLHRLETDGWTLLVYPLLWTLLARPRGELGDVRAAPSSPYIPSRPVAHRATPSSPRQTDVLFLSSPLDTASKPRGELERPGSPSSPYILSRPVAHRATPSSLETDGCIGLSSPLDTASKAERGTKRPGSPSSPYISRPGSLQRTAQLHRLETDGCIGLSSPLDTASKAERGTRRPGSPDSPYIPSRLVAHRATPSSLETDGCRSALCNSIFSRDRRMYCLSSPLTLLARPRGGTRRPGSPSSPYIPSGPGAHAQLHLHSRQTDVLARSAPRNSIVSRDRRMYWFISPLTLLASKAERRGTRRPYIPVQARSAALVLRRIAPRNSIVSRQTDVLVYLSFDTPSKAERGNKTSGSPSSPYIPSRPARSALRNSIISGRQTDVLVYPLLWTLLARPRGELDVRAALVLHIPSRLVAHRATHLSRQTDVLVYPPWTLLARPRGGTRRPGSPSLHISCPGPPVAHRATPSSLETDGCIGLSSPLDTASKAEERGTRRPGSPFSSPYILSRLASALRNSIVSRDRRMYWFILSWTLLARPRGELDVRAALVLHISRPGPPVAHRATPSSLETDGCIGLSLLWTLLARLRGGEPDVRAALVLHIPSRLVGTAQLHRLSRQTDACSALRNPSSLETDGCGIGLSSPLDTASKAERGTRRPGSLVLHISRPGSLVAHRATPSSLETDGCIGLSSPLDTASKAERAHRATPSSETDGCIGLSSPLDTPSKAERGTRRPGSPSSPYIRPGPWPVAHRATPSSRDRRMYGFILSFDTASKAERGELDVRAALVLHISWVQAVAHCVIHRLSGDRRMTDGCIGLAHLAQLHLVAHRVTPSSPETSRQTDVLVYPLPLDTASKAERGTRRPGSPSSSIYPVRDDGCRPVAHVRQVLHQLHRHRDRRIAPPNSIVSRDRQTDVLVYSVQASKGRDGELDVRAALVLHIPSRPSQPIVSRQTDVLVYPLLWTLLARPRGETSGEIDVRAARMYCWTLQAGEGELSVQARARSAPRNPPSSPGDRRMYWLVAHRATPSSLETDGCIGLSSPLDTASKAERGTRRPAALVLHISRPGPLVAHRATPSSLETDGCLDVARTAQAHRASSSRQTDVLVYPLLWTLLARPRGGERPGSPSSPYIPSVAHRQLHRLSRQTDVLVYPPWTLLARPRGGTPMFYPVQARSAPRNPSSPETDGFYLWFILLARPRGHVEAGLVLHRPSGGTPSSETDGCWFVLPRGEYSPSRPVAAPRNSIFTRDRRMYWPVAHRATPSSLETDGCPSRTAQLHLHPRQTDVLVYPLLWTLLAKAERGNRRPGSPCSPYIPSRPVAHRATPSSLETD